MWLSPTVKAAHITEYNQTFWENYAPIATQVLKTYTGRQVCIHIYVFIYELPSVETECTITFHRERS